MLESREETSRRCRANEAQRPAPQGHTSFQAWPDTTTNKVRGPGAHSSYSKALPLIHFAGAGAGGTGIGRMFAIRQPVAVLTSV